MLRDNKQFFIKLKEFKKSVAHFINHEKSSVEEIHTLRKSSRELLSLICKDEFIYKKIKKIIKLSNLVRDIDVFFDIYLESLPQKYISKLDIENIVKSTNKIRKKQIKKLHKYLETLFIPNHMEVEDKHMKYTNIDGNLLKLNQIELHQYRINIKKRLSIEKHRFLPNVKKVKVLSSIKNILGLINDYYNGLEMLKEYQSENVILIEVENYTYEQQYKLYRDFKRIVKDNSSELV